MTQESKRTPPNEPAILARDGWLTLRVNHNGKRLEVRLGLTDTKRNRKLAEIKRQECLADVLFKRFDPDNRDKYKFNGRKTNRTPSKAPLKPGLAVLWREYCAYKSTGSKAKTLSYREDTVGRHIEKIRCQDIENAIAVREALLSQTTVGMAKRCLTAINAAVNWGIKHRFIDIPYNPYIGMASELGKFDWQKEPGAKAFTPREKQGVLDFLDEHEHYCHYSEFVRFLFQTGCRPSEAVGLRWDDISQDYSTIKFAGSVVTIRGRQVWNEGSKNNRVRVFPVNEALKTLLKSISPNGSEYVFTSPSGLILNYANFTRRAWRDAANANGLEGCTPYSCRDTFISEQIAAGVPIAVVARWVDNSVAMIEQRYLDGKLIEHILPV